MGKNRRRLRSTTRAVLIAGFILSVTAQASTSFTTIAAGNSEYVNFNPAATNLFRNVTQISRADVGQGIASTLTYSSSDESASTMDLSGAAAIIPPAADLLFLYNGEVGLSVDPLVVPAPARPVEDGLVFNNTVKTDPVVGLQIESNLQALSYLGLNSSGIGPVNYMQIYSNADLWLEAGCANVFCPEPVTWILMASGLGGLVFMRRRADLFSRIRS
jgi:hypothetical protein